MAVLTAAEVARALFEHAADAIVLVDRSRRVRALNPAASHLLGWEPEAACHLPCQEVLGCLDGQGRAFEPHACPCMQAQQGVPVRYFEMTVRGGGGQRVPVSVSASAVQVEGEEMVSVILRDLSAQRKLASELDARRREAEFLYGLARDLASLPGADTGIRAALDRLRQFYGLDVAGLLELEDSGRYLYYRFLSGTEQDFSHERIPVAESLHGPVITAGEVRVIPDWEEDLSGWKGRAPLMTSERVKSAVYLPLKSRGQVLGSLVLGSRTRRTFGEAEVELLKAAADHLAVAFDNYRLYSRLKDQAVAEERRRLAAEIHDSLAQTIAIIGQRVRELRRMLVQGSREVGEYVEALERVVDQAHREVRQAIFDLKSPVGLGPDFIETLREYLEEFSLIHHIPVELVTAPDTGLVVPLQMEVQLFRIVQEALSNVRKHSQASRVVVQFARRGPGLLVIRVEDDGIGFDVGQRPRKGHYGLQIMQERAKSVGGLMTVRSQPGRGTVVEVEIPLAKE
ncbi:PAS domain-containing sensor histidine kinase [Caldinitratiruptor microaerophilus]|uniref:histidine kinase n=1 Tax=Caldinitratiruptor microaerophilus TaxID=671077 RepID=A0AA35CP79_9FIRM|nr:ATP-binding protein [Caldinitratiruptor microaerophilus]BDG61091.1 hypothetical protein caldi_21810 [Caldinitratiruptor microaerophilus]